MADDRIEITLEDTATVEFVRARCEAASLLRRQTWCGRA